MPKYEIWKTVTTDWMMVVEAESDEDVLDVIADGEWEFVEGDENIDDIVLLDEKGSNSLLAVQVAFDDVMVKEVGDLLTELQEAKDA
jgi:hypothetical protein